MTLPQGSLFWNQVPFGSNVRPSAALIAVFPDLAFDTYVATTTSQDPTIPGRANGPGNPLVGEGREMNVAWGATPNTVGGPGPHEIARWTWTGGGLPDVDFQHSRIYLASDPAVFGNLNFLQSSGIIGVIPEPSAVVAAGLALLLPLRGRPR